MSSILYDENGRNPQTFQHNGGGGGSMRDGTISDGDTGIDAGVVYHCNVKLIINYVSFPFFLGFLPFVRSFVSFDSFVGVCVCRVADRYLNLAAVS